MAAYGQTQYSPAIQPAGPYTPYTHHTQGYSVPPYSECSIYRIYGIDAFANNVHHISLNGALLLV